MNKKFDNAVWLVCIISLLTYFFPYFYLGQDSFLTVHDNLENDFHYIVLLKNTQTALNFDFSAVIPQVMNGLPRSALRSGLNLEVWTFIWFEPFTAFLINFVLIHTIGFVGMYLFLKDHVFQNQNQLIYVLLISLCFAFVPTYMVHGISVHGQPLLLWAFINIQKKQEKYYDWLIILLFPLYSFLVWAGLFIWTGLFIWAVYRFIKYRKIDIKSYLALFGLGLGYVITEVQMIYAFLFKVFVSHRTEYDYAMLVPMNLKASLTAAFQLLIQTYYHSGAYITILILLLGLLSLSKSYFNRDLNSFKTHSYFLFGIIFICLFHGFYRFLTNSNTPLSHLAVAFQFDRFYFLLPFVWLWWLAILLKNKNDKNLLFFGMSGQSFKILMIGLQMVLIIMGNKEWLVNAKRVVGMNQENKYPSYRAFYAERQFDDIKKQLNPLPKDYRILCIGFHPAVAQHNNFYTLDAFQNNYPLPYKHQFRAIIAGELAKNSKVQRYFDGWGTRCYTYVDQLSMNAMQGKTIKRDSLKNLALNLQQFKKMNGKYIFSTNPIDCRGQNLSFVRKFDDSQSFWQIFVYEVNSL